MKVGIIGAGTMGSGIAQAFAQTEGYEVVLCDINEQFAANGKSKIAKGFEKRIAKGKMDQAVADSILAKITTGTKEKCTDCGMCKKSCYKFEENVVKRNIDDCKFYSAINKNSKSFNLRLNKNKETRKKKS